MIWHLDSIYFTDQKIPLTWILGLKVSELFALDFIAFWGPPLFDLEKLTEIALLPLLLEQRSEGVVLFGTFVARQEVGT